MAKTKDRLYDTADTMRPYVDRALHDEELRDNLKEAFKAARDVYAELLGNREPDGDRDARRDRQGHPGQPEEGGRGAPRGADRIQGKEDHSARNTMLLLVGITVGILFNPMTGPADPPVAHGEDHRRELGRLLVRRRSTSSSSGPSTNSQQVLR